MLCRSMLNDDATLRCKRFSLFFAVLVVGVSLVSAIPAWADVVAWSQPITGNPIGGWQSASNPSRVLAEEFTLTKSGPVTGLRWWGGGSNATQFDVYLYANGAGNLPNRSTRQPLGRLSATRTDTGWNNSWGQRVYRYDVTLPAPLNLAVGATYWLAIVDPGYAWGWQDAGEPGYPPALRGRNYSVAASSPGASDWNISWDDVQHNLAFEVLQSQGSPGPGPVTVTINQAGSQADPTNASPIRFSVVFSEPVSDFTAADVIVSGTAGATTATVAGSGTTFDVALSGMTRSGTVLASIPAGCAHNTAGTANGASTSTDNTVAYDITAPTVAINQAGGQADPTVAAPIHFTVVFSEPVSDFTSADLTVGGTAGATTAGVAGSGTTYDVAVSGVTRSGTVVVSVPAGAAHDAAGNANQASTSSDNTVTYNMPPGPGGAAWSQSITGSPADGWQSASNPSRVLAEDFTLASAAPLTALRWWGGGSNTTQFDVYIFGSTTRNLPNPSARQSLGRLTATRTDTGQNNDWGQRAYRYDATLSSPLYLTKAATYWIAIVDPGYGWQWQDAGEPGYPPALRGRNYAVAASSPGASDWNISWDDVQHNLAFEVIQVQETPGLEPVTVTVNPPALPIGAENIYHIGNSHTWDMQPSTGFRSIGKSLGVQINNGWHIDCGHSLRAIADVPGSACVEPNEYGLWQDALEDFAWDAVILQPYPGATAKEEEQAAVSIIQYALDNSGGNPPRFFLYATWPQNTAPDLVNFDYGAAWLKTFGTETGYWTASRGFYDWLSAGTGRAGLNAEVNVIVAGEVLYAFDTAARAGKIPGFTGAGGLYRDAYHMNNIGKYLVSLTVYATVFSADPRAVGLISDFEEPRLDEELAGIIAGLVNRVLQGETP